MTEKAKKTKQHSERQKGAKKERGKKISVKDWEKQSERQTGGERGKERQRDEEEVNEAISRNREVND